MSGVVILIYINFMSFTGLWLQINELILSSGSLANKFSNH